MARQSSHPVTDRHGKRVKNLTVRETLQGRVYERQTYANGKPGPKAQLGPPGTLTKDEAIAMMRRLDEQRIAEKHSAMKQRRNMKLADVAETYFAATEEYISRARTLGPDPAYKGVSSMRTLDTYRTNWRKYIEPFFRGKTFIHDMDTARCTAFLRWLRRLPGQPINNDDGTTTETTLSEGTVNSVRSTLSGILAEARNLQAMNFDPLLGIMDRDRPRPVVRPSYIKTTLRREQLLSIVQAAPDGYKKALVTLAILTGMRPSEVVGLVWDDVRLDERHIYLTGSVGDSKRNEPVERVSTKTGKSRAIPLVPEVVSALRAHRLIEWGKGLGREGDFVFTSDKGAYRGRPVQRQLLLKETKKAAAAAGIEKIDMRAVRRSVATWHANSDTPHHAAAAAMGHSVKTFREVYVQNHDDQAAIDAVIAAMQNARNA